MAGGASLTVAYDRMSGESCLREVYGIRDGPAIDDICSWLIHWEFWRDLPGHGIKRGYKGVAFRNQIFPLIHFSSLCCRATLSIAYNTSPNMSISPHLLSTTPHKMCSQIRNASHLMLHHTKLPYTGYSLAITSILLRHGLLSSVTLGDHTRPDPTVFNETELKNRKIWVNLKYRGGDAVIRRLDLISKPSQRVFVTKKELGLILTGRRAKNVSGLGIGEILVVKTDPTATRRGRDVWMDGWEAWRTGLGGEIVCRAS
jgi:ribosomal protein S8